MLIKITDPVTQTFLFAAIFLLLLVSSTRKSQNESFFNKEATNQLKGFAILTIIFSHIGFFLYSDQKFLYPFSILAGVGVNLFLFLSGFGLTVSHLKSPLSPFIFYKKRLSKIFIPVWVVITIFLLADFFWLARNYPLMEIIKNYLGLFTTANPNFSLNSPLWYFTLILFYYLIFPWIFFKKAPWISPVLILIISLILIRLPLPVSADNLALYKLHLWAFPLGMLFGLVIQHIKFKLNKFLKLLILTIAVVIFLYTSVNSGVGGNPKIEQAISLITTLTLVIIFSLSRFNFKLLSIFGIYSYEIYLLHWPILSRFNLFLGFPPVLMVILNLGLILFLGFALQKIIKKITKQLSI